MPLPGINPNRPRSLSEGATPARPSDQRDRAASASSVIDPPQTTTTYRGELTKEEFQALEKSLFEWQSADGFKYDHRVKAYTEFVTSLNEHTAVVEHGQILMPLYHSDDQPALPELLAEKKDAAGMLLEKAKVKFIFQAPPFGQQWMWTGPKELIFAPPDSGDPRDAQEPAFGDPIARTSLPFPVRDDANVADGEEKAWVQEPPPQDLPRPNNANASSAQSSPRSSARSSPRPSAESSPRPSASERLSNWGRNLFSPRRSGPDNDALQVLKTETPLSANVLTRQADRPRMVDIEKNIVNVARAKRASVADQSMQVLNDIQTLGSRVHKLDYMKNLTLHLIESSPFPREREVFAEIGRQLNGIQIHLAPEENAVFRALRHFSETRGSAE